MVPLVVSGIPLEDSVDGVLEELCKANTTLDIAGNLRQATRLKRWKNTPLGKTERIMSTSVLLWATPQLAHTLLEQTLVSYEYRWLPVKPFNPPEVTCLRCDKKGHLASNCRNPPRCRTCQGPHNTRECPNKLKHNNTTQKRAAPTEERGISKQIKTHNSFAVLEEGELMETIADTTEGERGPLGTT